MWLQLTSHLDHERMLLSLEKEQVRKRLTLLTVWSKEASVTLASITIDGLHTFTMPTAGCRGTGSYKKHNPDEDNQLLWC